MNAYLNLFKAVPVCERVNSFSIDYIEYGVLVEDSVISRYTNTQITDLVKHLVPSKSQMNKTFHKSWEKVRYASVEQLVAEQLTHYFTTYGLESLGFYNSDTIYIPNEKLELDSSGGITFYILRGITYDEIVSAVYNIISSGMALSDSDLKDLVDIIKQQSLQIDPSISNNREMSVRLYDMLKITPSDPSEYLRLQVYLATGSTLLIKSRDAIEAISNADVGNIFSEYEALYGLEKLASIFYRFKPIFLAFKNSHSASTVNRIRRLATKYHRPMPEDYLGSVTKHLRNGTLDIDRLCINLTKANIFRKIKLAQALRFYSDVSASGVVYSIRNGKSFATTVNPLNANTDEALLTVMESLVADLSHLRGKRVYMDAGLVVPTSGKTFCGNIPFGSYFSTDDSLVLGVSWNDVDTQRVDLDLSIISAFGKIGWDGRYRNTDFLFSGDVTAAPKGATEAHLVRADARDGIYLLNLNYFNPECYELDVPFTLFVTRENEFRRMESNSMMAQDNMLFWADSVINSKHKQKIVGVLKINGGIKTFHVFEFKTGHSITAYNDEKSANTIAFYNKYLDSLISMKELLEWAGVEVVNSQDEADVDLSVKSLTKSALINLMTNK
jgi:hypothetical protein